MRYVKDNSIVPEDTGIVKIGWWDTDITRSGKVYQHPVWTLRPIRDKVLSSAARRRVAKAQ